MAALSLSVEAEPYRTQLTELADATRRAVAAKGVDVRVVENWIGRGICGTAGCLLGQLDHADFAHVLEQQQRHVLKCISDIKYPVVQLNCVSHEGNAGSGAILILGNFQPTPAECELLEAYRAAVESAIAAQPAFRELNIGPLCGPGRFLSLPDRALGIAPDAPGGQRGMFTIR